MFYSVQQFIFLHKAATRPCKSKMETMSEMPSHKRVATEIFGIRIESCRFVLPSSARRLDRREVVAHCHIMASAQSRPSGGSLRLIKVDLISELGTLTLRGHCSQPHFLQLGSERQMTEWEKEAGRFTGLAGRGQRLSKAGVAAWRRDGLSDHLSVGTRGRGEGSRGELCPDASLEWQRTLDRETAPIVTDLHRR